jgi:hypothetical protein
MDGFTAVLRVEEKRASALASEHFANQAFQAAAQRSTKVRYHSQYYLSKETLITLLVNISSTLYLFS